jgi:hypothetical protein
MPIADWFNTFCDNLVVRDGDTISMRYKSITRRLNTDYWSTESETAHSLYVGSYGRNTAIAGFSDLDMVMQLPYEVYHQYNGYEGNGQSALLQAVRKSLQKTYQSTDVGGDGQVVEIRFSDGITFQVVPGFLNNDNSYTFPDSNGGGKWRTTNPRSEIEAIRARNASCNGNLVRLCRMARAWKRKWDVPIGGLLIDTLAYQFIENYQYREKSYLYYDFMSKDFFEWMANQDRTQDVWRAPGSGQYVYWKDLFQYKAKRCYNIAVEAIQRQTASEDWSAKYDWRSIYGTAFPD